MTQENIKIPTKEYLLLLSFDSNYFLDKDIFTFYSDKEKDYFQNMNTISINYNTDTINLNCLMCKI